MSLPLQPEQFNAACSRYARTVILVVLVTVAVMCALYGLYLPFKHGIRSFCARAFGPDAAEILMGLVPLPAVIAMYTGYWWTRRASKKIPELFCPHCNKCVAGVRDMVVATKRCPYCRQQILADTRRG